MMTELSLTIIHLLHNMRVCQAHILADEFVKSFNLSIKNSSLTEKSQSLNHLNDNGYIQINKDGYIGLTKKGGQFWESHFLIDWDLYFEYGGQFIDDKEVSFFYAVNKNTLQLAIDNSNGLFDDCHIKIDKDWQPIYWQTIFGGFYIEKALDIELLPNYHLILPSYYKIP